MNARLFLLLTLVAAIYLIALSTFSRQRNTIDGSDSWGYYVHLPALFLYHDTGEYTKTFDAWRKNYPNRADPREDAYGVRPTATGKLAVKYPIGVALLESPFFLAAHAYCSISGNYPADGFSLPYGWAVSLSSVFYAVLGLFFLYKNLRFSFSDRNSLLTVGAIGLASNLYFFSSFTLGMSHPVAFCLIALV
jgi:hypothetical protein